MEENKELTYGQKAVGLTFNPSNDPKVQKIKELYAEIIDICNEVRHTVSGDGADNGIEAAEKRRLASIAITQAQDAQMWAVKAITWK